MKPCVNRVQPKRSSLTHAEDGVNVQFPPIAYEYAETLGTQYCWVMAEEFTAEPVSSPEKNLALKVLLLVCQSSLPRPVLVLKRVGKS